MQDNNISILLEKNGRLSISKRNKHINNRYFFVIDRVSQCDLEIELLPTNRMWDDILTKLLNDISFKEFRAEIMNCLVEYEEESAHEDSGNTTGVSNTNAYVQTGCYRS